MYVHICEQTDACIFYTQQGSLKPRGSHGEVSLCKVTDVFIMEIISPFFVYLFCLGFLHFIQNNAQGVFFFPFLALHEDKGSFTVVPWNYL